MIGSIVIVGDDPVGAETARQLRAMGYQGELTLIHDAKFEAVDAAASDEADIRHVRGDPALGLERAARNAVLSSGARVPYDRLVLATGATHRSLPSDADAKTHNVTGRADMERLRRAISPGSRVIVVGGGFAGLEAAAAARHAKASVILIEAGPRLLPDAASPQLAALFEAAHRAEGVEIITAATVTAVRGRAVVTGNDRRLEADMIVVCVGSDANDGLARAAGIACADARFRTNDPAIFAAGPSATSASSQPRALACALLDLPPPPAEPPRRRSRQYDLDVDMAGVRRADDEIILRRREDGPGLTLLHLSGGSLSAVEAVNDPETFAAALRIIAGPAALIDVAAARDGEIALRDAVRPALRACA